MVIKVEACYIKGDVGQWAPVPTPDFHSPEDEGDEVQALQDYLTAYVPPTEAVALRFTSDFLLAYVRIHPKYGMVPRISGADTIWPTNEELGGIWEAPHVLPDGHIITLNYVEPAERFEMGDDESHKSDRRLVKVEGQFLAKTATTVEQWNWYAEAVGDPNKIKPTKNEIGQSILDHPVTEVNFWDSVDWAAWAGLGIPTEEEWERAARGNDSRKYPWGNERPTTELCHFSTPEEEQTGTASVYAHPKGMGPYGHLDLSGNTWEWCNSPWRRE